MRLKSIHAANIPPIKTFQVDDLSDLIVLAGPNGVGKTRLIEGLLHYFQSFQKPSPNASIRLVIEVTCEEERTAWGTNILDTNAGEHVQKLRNTLQANRRRKDWKSSVLNFESDRTIQQISPYSFSWENPDPWQEQIGWHLTFGGLRNRFQDTLHSLFRKVQSHKDTIANKALSLIAEGHTSMPLDPIDPVSEFKVAFSQLLAPKQLLNVDPRTQQLNYLHEGQTLPISSLSSGEREVINIVFDFILRNPSDCIIVFDEPELHLHPELSYKLLQTLKGIGQRNQFILCTHSPDIITASLDNSVVFIAPPKQPETNQAIVVREDDATNQALKRLGQSIGIIALGKKIVLIEGTHSSLDKEVYGSILKARYPSLVLVPSGGKGLILSFASLFKEILERTIWGVEFYMLCDRDALPPSSSREELEAKSKGRFRVLSRYHIENYFLDEHVLAKVFSAMEPADSWLRSPSQIRSNLKSIASELVSYSTALIVSAEYRLLVGNLDIMPSDCHNKSAAELLKQIADRTHSEKSRITSLIDPDKIATSVNDTTSKLQASLQADTDDWKSLIPGKPLLSIFAAKTPLDISRLKRMYLGEAEKYDPGPFTEIIDTFGAFNSATADEQTTR